MADPVKRLHYFDHQFLRAKDFTDEQGYNIRMRRLHNQLLHVWGVAQGLDLTAPAGATRVTVRAGVAIDGQGRELVLPADTQTVDLSGFTSKPVFVTLRYDEQLSDPTTETGAEGTTRSTEAPIIEVSLTPPADASLQLILGQAVIGADGKIASTNAGTDPNRRRSAGVVGGDLSVSSLTIGDPSISTDRWAHVRLGAPNRIDSDSGLRIAGNLGVGTDPSTVAADFGGPGRIRVRQGAAGTAGVWFNEGAKGDRGFVGMSDDNNVGLFGAPVGWGLVMNSDTGNVGIGLGPAASDHRLHVKANGAVGLFESTSNNAFLRVATTDGLDKRVELCNRPGGTLALWLNNADRLSILQNGNVGIASTAPDRNLTVSGPGLTGTYANVKNASHEVLVGVDSSAILSAMTVSDLQIRTNNVTRMVVQANTGNVGIGVPAPAHALDVNSSTGIKLGLEASGGGQLIIGNNLNDNCIYMEAWNSAGTDHASNFLLTGHFGQNVPVLSLNAVTTNVAGNAFKPGGGSWGSLSDQRLKKNISTLTGVLDKLLSLRGVSFEWKDPAKFGNLVGTQMGLVAQEVEQVFPEWVGLDAEGVKTLSIRGFEALTIEAFREIRDEFTAVKAAVAELESKLGAQAKDQKSAEKTPKATTRKPDSDAKKS